MYQRSESTISVAAVAVALFALTGCDGAVRTSGGEESSSSSGGVTTGNADNGNADNGPHR